MRAGDLLAGRFDIESRAGGGGMGVVFRARDRVSGEPVAVKVLHATGDDVRFAREARLLAELVHPRIVRHVAHGTTPEGSPWLAMEWLEGEDLGRRLARAPLSIDESLDVALGAAEALAAAHALGIVHRDIKPGNLFLVDCDLRRVKLVDFGLARLSQSVSWTASGMLLGTPGYIAPEQARGERDVDARADIFSLGCVLFRCVTGCPVFTGENALAVLAKLVLEETPFLRDVAPQAPEELGALVARMLAKERSTRPRDGRAALDALTAIRAGGANLVAPPPSPHRALTTGEERLFSIVMVMRVDGELPAVDLPLASGDERAARVPAIAARHGGDLHLLADGTVLCAFAGAATDRAARCASELAVGDERVVLATGRARVEASGTRAAFPSWPVGEAIDRAVEVSKTAAAGRVAIDDVTAVLLSGRFAIAKVGERFELAGAHVDEFRPRTLLGRRTRCVGRDRELAMLAAFWDECVNEPRCRPVLVSGPAGIGKTRLVHEFITELGSRGAPPSIWIARSDSMGAGSPLRPLSRAIKRAAGIQDGEPLEARRSKLRLLVGRHLAPAEAPRVAEFIGELTATPLSDEASVHVRAARADPKVMADQVRAAWEDLVVAECSAGPLLLVLDDLHWGDAPTVSFVDGALRNLGERPWMVLALGRPEVHDVFRDLWLERDVQEMRLDALSRRSSEQLVRDALGAPTEPSRIARVVERAAGNAFFLEELIRSEARGDTSTAPETVLSVVETRLTELDAETRRIARAASIYGRTFWSGAVAALVGGSDRREATEARLQDLVRREIVSTVSGSRFPGEGEYSFRHAIVRDAAYAMLTPDDRALGHRLAAGWLERAGEDDALLIAEHFEVGGDRERSSSAFLAAARQALAADDLAAAVARAERGVRSGARGELLGQLRLVQAEAHEWLGANAHGERCAREAMSLVPVGTELWFYAANWCVALAGHTGNRERIVEVSNALLEAPFTPSSEPIRARALYVAAQHYQYEVGDNARVDALIAAVDEQRAGDAARARLPMARALRALRAGDVAAYLRAAEESAARFERIGDRRRALNRAVDIGFTLVLLGRPERAEPLLRTTLAAVERMGVASVAAVARNNLGLALSSLGRLDEAKRTEEQAIAAFIRHADPRLEGNSRIYLAEILLAAGDAPRAIEEARRAADILENVPSLRAYARAVLARAALAGGEIATAGAAARDAFEGLADVHEGHSTICLARAEVLLASGVHAAARDAARFAYSHLLERAQRISDPSFRATFLECVPANASIVALHRSLGA